MSLPVEWTDETFVPFDWGWFAFVYDSTKVTNPPKSLQELVDAGRLTLAEARSHRAANLVTRAVGARPHLELDGVYGSLEAGDRLLLCSDGLGVLSESEVGNLVSSGELPAAAENLMRAALDRGAPDNVTLILVEPIAS